MKTVFIFGAGAARQAGAPLMSDFIDKAEELYRGGQPGVREATDEFIDVFKAISDLRAIHQKAYLNLDNFEILFGAIEMANLTGKLASRSRESIAELRKSIITLIVKTLEYSILFPVINGKITPPPPYGDFARMLVDVNKEKMRQTGNRPKLSFLTFNYDLALDYTLHYMEGWGHFDYCLSEEADTEKYPLLKLHGSINWGVCPECNKIISFDFDDLHYRQNYLDNVPSIQFKLGTDITQKQHHGRPLNHPPVLVPPTWNKTGYHEELAHVWSKASRELEEAENIFVIGYSLPETDSFFRYLYALGSESETRIKRFWVFNPDPDGTVKSRFDALIGQGIENRYKFISGGLGRFEKAIPQIKNELLKVF